MPYSVITSPDFNLYHRNLPDAVKQKYSREEFEKHPLYDVYSFGKVLCFLFFGKLVPPLP